MQLVRERWMAGLVALRYDGITVGNNAAPTYIWSVLAMRRFSMLALVAMILVGSYTTPASAACPYGSYITYRDYYNGCGSQPTIIGDEGTDCPGNYYSTGSTNGHWKVEYYQECIADPYCHDGDVFDIKYYERCSGAWVQRSQNDFSTGNCQCS